MVQLDQVLASFKLIAEQTKYDDFSDVSLDTYGRFRASALGVINRVAGPDSIYAKQADALPFDKNFHLNNQHIPILAGIVQALRNDVASGFLDSARELFHGELFSDFLEMADFLLSEGYKDAAAVIGGGVLETHLRQLCIRHGIDVDVTVGTQTKAKKAEQLNNDLTSANVYSKLDQKNVTSWLDLRNKAAHAKYAEYTKEQVALLFQSIRDFITRHPA